MAEFNTNDKKRNPKNNNNIYWIYVVVLAFFIIGSLLIGGNDNKQEITFSEFSKMWEDGKVKEVVVINGTEVDIVLQNSGSQSSDSAPQYFFKVSSADTFQEYLITNNIPFKV